MSSPPSRDSTPPLLSRERIWSLLSALLLVGVLGVMLATFLDYGITWDEGMHNRYGRRVVRWYTSGGTDTGAIDPNGLHFYLYLYGGLFELAAYGAERVSPLGLYETRHLVNLLFGFVGLVAAWGLGAHLGGPAAGFLSALFLALTPAFYGHAFANPKDIPLASLFALAAWAALRASDRGLALDWRAALPTGVAIGLAAGVRVAGIVLFAATAALWVGGLWLPAGEGWSLGRRPRGRDLARVGLAVLATIAVGWTLMVSVWPWALLDPIRNPFRALLKLSHFRDDLTVLYEGQLLTSAEVSRYYIPKLFALTLPEFYFLAFLIGGLSLAPAVLASARRVPSRKVFQILWVSGLAGLPVVWVVVRHTPFYDGHRHLLFVVPLLAALAGVAAAAGLQGRLPRPLRILAALALSASLLLTAWDMVQLHPYQYVFFNRLFAGGLPGAVNKYETDYWCASYKEGIEWAVRQYSRPGRREKIRLAGYAYPGHVGLWRYLERSEEGRQQFEVVKVEDDPHLILATTALRDQEQTPGRVVHVVERQGAALLYVFEARTPE